MTTDSVFAIFSTTKAVTGVTVMQLVEEGKISLSDPAKKYVPAIGELRVLDGFDAAGQPKTRPPKRDITVNDLILHTSGLCYECFSADDLKYRDATGVPFGPDLHRRVDQERPAARPGRALDLWREHRLARQDRRAAARQAPGRSDEGAHLRPARHTGHGLHDDRLDEGAPGNHPSTGHQDGKLTPQPELALPQPPELEAGGLGLYSTVGDYMKFIRMFLNDGAGPNGRVLKAETVAQMCEDGLAKLGLASGGWPTSMPSITNAGEFFPGVAKGWAYTFQFNREETPSGRPAGSLMWAGLPNCFYWIDRKNGVGGYWASQILPFQDIASYTGFGVTDLRRVEDRSAGGCSPHYLVRKARSGATTGTSCSIRAARAELSAEVWRSRTPEVRTCFSWRKSRRTFAAVALEVARPPVRPLFCWWHLGRRRPEATPSATLDIVFGKIAINVSR